MPWGAVIGAGAALLGSSMQAGAADRNSAASQATAANELNATKGYGITGPFGQSYINSNNGSAGASLSGPYGGIESGLLGGAGQSYGALSGLLGTGGITPLLANAYSQYQGNLPSASLSNVPNFMPSAFFGNPQNYLGLANGSQGLAAQYLGQASNPTQIQNNGFGAQLTGAGAGLLGQYSQYNPQQTAAQYAGALNALQAPQQQVAAQGLAQQLFNSGNLGSTGGANQLGALETSQGLQQQANNVAGMQLGQQNQLGMLGMANQLGASGTNLDMGYAGLNSSLQQAAMSNYGNAMGQALNIGNFGTNALYNQSNTAFNRGMTLDTTQFGQQGQLAQNLFNANLGIQGAGLSNIGAYQNAGSGMLSGAQSIDQSLLNQIMMGGQLGAMRSGAAISAGNTALAGQIAANNTNASMYSGLFNSIGNANWGSLFKPNSTGGSMGGTNYGNMATQGGYAYNDPGNY